MSEVVLDQRKDGGDWLSLGRYRIDGLSSTLTVTSGEDSVVIADAVRHERRDRVHVGTPMEGAPGLLGAEYTVDDGQAFYLENGPWIAADDGYGGDARSSIADNAAAAWQFAGVAPDVYDVLVSYEANAQNTQTAEYIINNGSAVIGRAAIDQREANAGWRKIATVTVTAPTVVVNLVRLAGGGVLRADAIKLVSTRCTDCQR